jgi:hypothetical protein
MSGLTAGLLTVLAYYGLLLLACVALAKFVPSSLLGKQARRVLPWLPPFVGGQALRNWAAATARQEMEKRLERKRTSETAIQLAGEIEKGAMEAMLPAVEPGERERIVPCPEMGQGIVGVTAPEALTIAAYLRKNCSPAEQERICEMAEENVKTMASSGNAERRVPPLPCPLQGDSHVCCVYAARPLRCRILHAITIATEAHSRSGTVEASIRKCWPNAGTKRPSRKGSR